MIFPDEKEAREFLPVRNIIDRDRESITGIPLPEWNPAWLKSNPIVQLPENAIIRKKRDMAAPIWIGLAASMVVSISVGLFYLNQQQLSELNNPGYSAAFEKSTRKESMKAIVLAIHGEVHRAGEKEHLPLHPGDILEGKQKLVTSRGAWLDLSLSSGITIHLEGGSTLGVERAIQGDQDSRYVLLNLEKGALLASIEKSSSRSEFDVVTPTAVAGVRGTVFRVQLDEAKTQVSVLEGAVEVKGRWRAANPVVVEEKQQVQIQAKEKEYTPVQRISEGEQIQQMEETHRTLLNLDEQIQNELGESVKEIKPVKSEEELMNRFDRGLELIELRDGRKFRGIIVSQSGNRMVVQTLQGVHVVERDSIERVLYLDP